MIALLLAIIGQVSDVATTRLVINAGGIEMNPLLGTDPNLYMVLIVKLIILILIYTLLKGAARTRVLTFGAIIGFGAAGWNLYILQDIAI